MSARTRIAPAAVAAALSLAVVVAPASATKPVGECTQSYSPYTLTEWLAIAPTASDVFQQVDHNGDGVICFKYYSNAPHQDIYLGNLIDDMAAPHS
jgi:hypothetical protein